VIEPVPVAEAVALGAAAGVAEAARAAGLVHGAGAAEHPFHVDPVPRGLAEDEWAALARGLVQRVEALEAFAADAHGPRRAVAAGVVPEAVLATSRYLEPGLPRPARYIGLAGPDVVRGADGELVVLEDNVRTPTMLGFALALRRVVHGHVPGGPDPDALEAAVLDTVRRMLRAAAPAVEDPVVAVLGDGVRSALRWELGATAALLGVPHVEPEHLRPAPGGRLRLPDGRAVDVLWRRTSEERLRDDDGRPNALGRLLLDPVRDGTVAVVNAFGAGIADDKRVFGRVEALVRFFLGEAPVLRSVPTYDAADVLDRLGELVVKPRSGSGGYGVAIRPAGAQLDRVRAAVEADPEEWIAQEVVELSTHPTVVDGALAPRHVDLRPFACWDGARVVVLPAAFTRVALEAGNMVVNASQGGGGKDTWVPAR
jgi:uncharacterized circularly permuted ATP-grasp superfamily protein